MSRLFYSKKWTPSVIININNMKINKKYLFDFNVINAPTPEFAYYLGWMWGDGCCRHRQKGSSYQQSLEIQREDGMEIVEFFETFCSPSKIFRHRTGRKPTINIKLYDQVLGKFLQEYDYEEKSVKSPEKILNFLSPDLHEYWFRGFFEADGHASFREQSIKGYMLSKIEFYAPINQDWNFLKEFLATKNINLKIIMRKRVSGDSSIAHFCKQEEVKSFINLTYSNKIDMKLERKSKTLNKMLQYINNRSFD